ncbi:MAG: hypothetical protein Q7S28_00075 [bacterium]|nr:hypothetical protein [bacterium]
MTRRRVADDQYGLLHRRLGDLIRRVDEGALPFKQVMEGLQDLIEGQFVSNLLVNLLTIDYAIKPSLINLAIENHPLRADMITVNFKKINLVPIVKSGDGYVSGKEIQKRLIATDKTLLDVRVMEELLRYPMLIPDSWISKNIFFWGTIFHDSNGRLYAPYIVMVDGRWRGSFSATDDACSANAFAACFSKEAPNPSRGSGGWRHSIGGKGSRK